MNTKSKIIVASVKLFNSHGVTKVSLRDIADKVGISHGNLAYHFKNKQWIIHEIYTRMEKEMDNAVYPGGDLSLKHYNDLFQQISDFQKKYRFFYLDMLEITRRYPKVIERYRETITKRRNEFDKLISLLISKGLMKQEPEIGFYRSLFHSIWVMSTFWLQHKKILGEDHPTIVTGNDIKHVWEILLPHLTDKGLKEYRDILAREEQSFEDSRPIQKLYLRKIS